MCRPGFRREPTILELELATLNVCDLSKETGIWSVFDELGGFQCYAHCQTDKVCTHGELRGTRLRMSTR
jgi:hypothetical protein